MDGIHERGGAMKTCENCITTYCTKSGQRSIGEKTTCNRYRSKSLWPHIKKWASRRIEITWFEFAWLLSCFLMTFFIIINPIPMKTIEPQADKMLTQIIQMAKQNTQLELQVQDLQNQIKEFGWLKGAK